MDVACFLSNQSAKMAPLVQIFFYFERHGKLQMRARKDLPSVSLLKKI